MIRVLLALVAHGDDLAVSANYLGTVCTDPAIECVAVLVTEASAPDDEALASLSMNNIHLGLPDLPGNTPQAEVYANWSINYDFQTQLYELISELTPYKIIVLDPRHGTGGHTSHLVVGWHTIVAANKAGYGGVVWVQSARRHIADSHFVDLDRGEDWSGFTPCVAGEGQVITDGWLNTYKFLSHYSRFFNVEKLLEAPAEWRKSVLLKWSKQDPRDPRYEACMGFWR